MSAELAARIPAAGDHLLQVGDRRLREREARYPLRELLAGTDAVAD